MNDAKNETKIKIILLGDSGTGKTSLINSFEGKNFLEQTTSTIGAQYIRDIIKINNNIYHLHIWDTAGQEQFRSVSKIYFKGADIIIFVYDITNIDSFKSLTDFWVDYVEKLIGKDKVFGLAANKVDLFDKSQVSKEEGEKFSKDINAIFKETSAKEDEQGFKDFIKLLVNEYILKNLDKSNNEESFKIKKQKSIKNKDKNLFCCF